MKSEGWRWDTDANEWTWDDITSRCIDTGNPGTGLGEEPVTLEVDPLNRWGKNLRINMGAYGGTSEASMGPPNWSLLSDVTNDGIVDFIDFIYFAQKWFVTGTDLPADLDRNGTVDFGDIIKFGNDWLKTNVY